MVDVSGKPVTVRTATAEALVRCPPQVVTHLRDQTVPKGDVLAVARIAGIAAAKRTPDLLPLAHVIGVHAVEVELAVVDDGVHISVTCGPPAASIACPALRWAAWIAACCICVALCAA